MPIVQPSFQFESSPESTLGGEFYGFGHILCLGIWILIASAATRYIFKLVYAERTQSSANIPAYSDTPWKASEKLQRIRNLDMGMSTGHAEAPLLDSELKGQGSEKTLRGENFDRLAAVKKPKEGIREVLEPHSLIMPSGAPPPPPLTFPEMSPTVFTLGGGKKAGLSHSDLSVVNTEAFVAQPNPDYNGESSSTALEQPLSSEDTTSATTPRRRSYTKTISAQETLGVWAETGNEVAPGSPLSSPTAKLPEHQVDVQGEIISDFDDAGNGWKRHTRVYGGGVCLACLHSGGGAYGENVRPEDRR